jgi:hypothetical protein
MGLCLVQINLEGLHLQTLCLAGLFLCPEGGGQHTEA